MHFLQNKQTRFVARGVGEALMLCGLLWWLVALFWEFLRPLFTFLGESGRIAMSVSLGVAVLLLLCEGNAKRVPLVPRSLLRGMTFAASGACLVAGIICVCVGFWDVACLVIGIGLVNLPAGSVSSAREV